MIVMLFLLFDGINSILMLMMLMLVNGSVGWPFSIFKLLLPLWVFVLAHYLSFSQKERKVLLSFLSVSVVDHPSPFVRE